jgi:methyl-accepting chemotaxis protein
MSKFFSNFKVSTKLLLGFSLLTLMTFAVGSLGLVNIIQLQALDQDLYTYQTLPLLELRVIHGAFEQNRATIRDVIFEEDISKVEAHLNNIDENRHQIALALETFSQSLLVEEEQVQFTYLVNVLENFHYHLDQIIELCRNGNKTFAYKVLSQDGPKLSENFSSAIENLSQIKEQIGQEVATSNKLRAEAATQQTIIFILITGALAISLGVAIARVISKPLAVLAKSADEIAQGNLTSQIPEEYRTTKDEVGHLGKVFHTMTASIRNLIHNVFEAAEVVASSSEELHASAAHVANVSSQIAGTVAATADGAQTQVTALAKAMVTVENMAKAVQQIVSNSLKATAVADEAAQASTFGSEKVDVVIKKMTDIKESVEHSAQMIAELDSRSNEIGQIVATISALSDQTNLLALNAAIEASRAGEEGRGFAVVAEEVRKLAEQSQLATKQIATLIHDIQTDTHKATTAMKKGTSEVQSGYEAVGEAGKAFINISELVQTVSEQIQEILPAVEGLAVDSRQVVDSVSAVEEISRQTSEQTHSISSASQEQSAAMEEVAASSDMLARLAERLQETVSKFKI